MISPEDRALVEAFRERTKEMGVSPETAADLAGDGLSGPTARRYMAAMPSRLTEDARRALRRFVTKEQGGAAQVREAPRAPYGEEPSDFARELAKLGAENLTAREKAILIDSIAAGFRAEALRRAEAAAEHRAAALRAEAEGAMGRQGVIDRVREIPTIPPTPVPRSKRRRNVG